MTNPTPQPHADDVKLAVEIRQWLRAKWMFVRQGEEEQFEAELANFIRLSNEALRERVKELENAQKRYDTACANAEALIASQAEYITAASEVIEKFEAYVNLPYHGGYTAHAAEQAIAAIKEWKENTP